MNRLVADKAVGTSLLTQNFEITHLISQVKTRCHSYGMDEVFNLVQPANNVLNPGQVTNTEINLFDNFASVTRDQVLASWAKSCCRKFKLVGTAPLQFL